ncbi:MAG: HAD-IA family hydrolase [Candidatus Lokiarchaeota archaeon]|nr:HAD-IA family hydrolase [Candidatus Lokiarchaeota archaeon]
MKNDLFRDKKVIVFDLDGTIVKLHASWYALKDLLSQRYARLHEENREFNRISAYLSEVIKNGDELELIENFDIIRKYELENIKKTEPIEEVVYFINNKEEFEVDPDVILTVLSLNTRRTIIESLDIAGISDKIAFIIGREDVIKWKPEPEGLFKIKEKFNVSTEQMIFFGDMDFDMDAGKAAGVDSFFIDILIKMVRDLEC